MQSYNPYLPLWEYIPDGEPHVFDGMCSMAECMYTAAMTALAGMISA